jgi:hypothetical protein
VSEIDHAHHAEDDGEAQPAQHEEGERVGKLEEKAERLMKNVRQLLLVWSMRTM